MATGVRHRRGLEMCKVVDISSSGMPVSGTGGARGFRDGVWWQSTVDSVQHGRPIVHLPATGGRGGPHQAWRIPQPGTGVSHRQV